MSSSIERRTSRLHGRATAGKCAVAEILGPVALSVVKIVALLFLEFMATVRGAGVNKIHIEAVTQGKYVLKMFFGRMMRSDKSITVEETVFEPLSHLVVP